MTSPFGGRSPRGAYLPIRLALVAALIVGGVVFHHRGPAYDVVRGVYIVAVLGFLAWRVARRRRGLQGYRGGQD